MPQYIAQRAFGYEGDGNLGHVRAGTTLTLTEAEAAKRNRSFTKENAILKIHLGPSMPQPDRNAMLPGAPQVKTEEIQEDFLPDGEDTDRESEDDAGNDQSPPIKSQSAGRVSGKGKPSFVSRRGRPLAKRK